MSHVSTPSVNSIDSSHVVDDWAPPVSSMPPRLLMETSPSMPGPAPEPPTWLVLDAMTCRTVTLERPPSNTIGTPIWCNDGQHLAMLHGPSGARLAGISIVEAAFGTIVRGIRICGPWPNLGRCVSPGNTAVALPSDPHAALLLELPSLQDRARLCSPVPCDHPGSELEVHKTCWSEQDLVIVTWTHPQDPTFLLLAVHAGRDGHLLRGIPMDLTIENNPSSSPLRMFVGEVSKSTLAVLPWHQAPYILLVDAHTGIQRRVVAGSSCLGFGWSPAGRFLVVTREGRTGSSWQSAERIAVDAATGEVVHGPFPIHTPESCATHSGLAELWLPTTGLCLVQSSMQLLNLAAPTSQQVLCTLADHKAKQCSSLLQSRTDFSPCGRVLVQHLRGPMSTLPHSAVTRHWVLEPGFTGFSIGRIHRIGAIHQSLAWHPTLMHTRIYAAADLAGNVHLVDADKHRVTMTWTVSKLRPKSGPQSPVNMLAWTPEGHRLVVGGTNGLAVISF